jgi:hypothetical protein
MATTVTQLKTMEIFCMRIFEGQILMGKGAGFALVTSVTSSVDVATLYKISQGKSCPCA